MMKNGYCEITVNGKTIGLKFNMYAIERYNEIKGIGGAKHAVAMVYGGMLGNCFVKQIEPEISFEEIVDWVDEDFIKNGLDGEMKRISECFNESIIIKAQIEKIKSNGEGDEELKKKVAEVISM